MVLSCRISTVRFLLAGALAVTLVVGCAGTTPPPPPVTPPPPTTEPAPVEIEPVPRIRTLADILGPVSFDPDTVKAGRFDTGRMWLFEAPPLEWYAEAYGFRPDEEWFAHAHLGALRSNGGECSASFVSPHGLMFTNHHCARDYVTQVSLEGENLLEDGFYAATLAEERRVEGFFTDQMVEITDVTARVHAAMDAVESPVEKATARQQEIQAIRDEFNERNGMVNEVVELFNGGRYSVYTFKRYDDVRLVMAPELDIGYFGGDPDNFTYPRYNLDISFWRVYEDGKPVDSSEFYFKWSVSGPRLGEPVFVIGNPGSTSRLNTVAQLASNRDYNNPYILNLLRTRMKVLRQFLDTHPDIPDWEEQNNYYFNLSNAEKAYSGRQRGLLDPWMLARKADWEESFRQTVLRDPELKERYGDPWQEIAEARFAQEPYGNMQFAFASGGGLRSAYLHKGFLLQQYRLMLSQGLAADSEQAQGLVGMIMEPIDGYPELEKGNLEAQLAEIQWLLGPDDEYVKTLLGMRQPEAAAQHILTTSVLGDTTEVRSLLEGAPESIEISTDPILAAMKDVFVRLLPMQMALQQQTMKENDAMARLARAVYDVYGTSIPPDATSSLRIQDGVVTGYPYNGTVAPGWTTFYGLYDRWASHGKKDPWELPERWLNPPADFDLDTPLNFVSTCDIIGGNSGSPLLNRDLEVVGIAFDGNIESLPGEFIFLPELNRCVSVHSAGIFEVISDLFGYKGLADELKTGVLPPAGR